MCGICGIINLNERLVESNEITVMQDLIAHRGPDDSGIYFNGNIGMGHVRLSILDLSNAGHQPMFSNDKNFVIVFNGEIYNYIELKSQLSSNYDFKTKTDTEVILAAYQKWGEDCLHKFNGDWAFVIYDIKNNKVFGARDRYGIKPFYYYHSADAFRFASEIKALTDIGTQPNYKNIFEYLVYNRTDHNDGTFFENIRKLDHGSKFIIEDNKFKVQKWYRLKDRISFSEESSIIQNALKFNELFKNAISIRLRSDVPVGVCLSGGLDSSSIVSTLLKEHGTNDLNTFSAIYQDYANVDESPFINLYSNQLKNMYYTRPDAESFYKDYIKFIEAQAEPVASIGPYAQFKVMELARNHVKVTIDGQGADEQLGGYHYFFGVYYKELLSQLKIIKLLYEQACYLQKHRSSMAMKYFVYYILPELLKKQANKRLFGNVNETFFNEYQKTSEIGQKLYNPTGLMESLYQHFENKLEHLLKWEDHNSMYFSIEARVPFLDHRIVEFLLGLKSDHIINNGETKYILRKAMQGVLPEEIRVRSDKKGFSTPSDVWFRNPDFQLLFEDIVNSQELKNRGLFNIKKCKKMYKEHLENNKDNSKEIWKIINLETWFRNNVDG